MMQYSSILTNLSGVFALGKALAEGYRVQKIIFTSNAQKMDLC